MNLSILPDALIALTAAVGLLSSLACWSFRREVAALGYVIPLVVILIVYTLRTLFPVWVAVQGARPWSILCLWMMVGDVCVWRIVNLFAARRK